jgi:hypothetical protein
MTVDGVLLRTRDSAAIFEGTRDTKSLAARHAFLRAASALRDWQLVVAETALTQALRADAQYARAALRTCPFLGQQGQRSVGLTGGVRGITPREARRRRAALRRCNGVPGARGPCRWLRAVAGTRHSSTVRFQCMVWHCTLLGTGCDGDPRTSLADGLGLPLQRVRGTAPLPTSLCVAARCSCFAA